MKPTLQFALLMLFWMAASASAAEPRPNVLLMFLDNVGYSDLGCYGNREIKTPRLDAFAGEAVRCTQFYIGSPSCSPSRGSILTGRHAERNGLNYQLSPIENMGGEGLPLSEKLLPAHLKPLGYATGAFGKWNIGFGPGFRPTERGFDEFLGHMSGNIGYFKHLYHGKNDMRRGTEPVDLTGRYATDIFADAAIEFIRRHSKEPWLVYLPFNAVHFVGKHNVAEGEPVEWQVPAKHLALYGAPPNEPDQRIRFRAVITALDEAIGRVLDAIDDAHLRERTLVMCISDNGAFMLPGRGLEVQSNLPLRSGGVTTYEGGIRVPALFRWPGKLPAGSTCNVMLSSHDVLPLAVNAAGGALPSDRVFDGRDPLPALQGKASSPHDQLSWVWNQGGKEQWRALRSGDWKIVRRTDEGPWELYNLARDMGESRNLADEEPARLASLVKRFDDWRAGIDRDPTRSRSLRK